MGVTEVFSKISKRHIQPKRLELILEIDKTLKDREICQILQESESVRRNLQGGMNAASMRNFLSKMRDCIDGV
jgi:hypothetical protein